MWEGLNSLQDLNLFENKITSIGRGCFQDITTLKKLDLSSNGLLEIRHDMWKTLLFLEQLNLRSNAIKILNCNLFNGLQSLILLNLEFNKIQKLVAADFNKSMKKNNESGSTWTGLTSLVELHLEYNNISYIGDLAFSGLPRLQKLYLYGNNLNSFSEQVFDPNDFPDSDGHPPNLTLSISKNPLQCDKRMCWLKKAEQEGWIAWAVEEEDNMLWHPDDIYKPNCDNIPDEYLPPYFNRFGGFSFLDREGFSNLGIELYDSDSLPKEYINEKKIDYLEDEVNDMKYPTIDTYGWDKDFCSDSGRITLYSYYHQIFAFLLLADLDKSFMSISIEHKGQL